MNILSHALRGCVSDPVEIPMYYYTHTRSNGLPIYLGVRGTSQLEAFHFHVARCTPTWSLSPQAMDATIMEFVIHWNINMAVKHLGARDYGFYSLEVLDDLVRVVGTFNMFTFHHEQKAYSTPFVPLSLHALRAACWCTSSKCDSKILKVLCYVLRCHCNTNYGGEQRTPSGRSHQPFQRNNLILWAVACRLSEIRSC